MDFKELFETIFTYDEEKPWSILIPQLLFYCFRNYCVKRVVNDITSNDIEWTNLYELCNMNCDPNFKLYIPDFFEPTVFEHIDDSELIEIFFKNFIISFNQILLNDNPELEKKFTQFLDKDLFIFFNNIITNKEYLIFPTDVEGELNEKKYLILRETKLNYSLEIDSEQLQENTNNYEKKENISLEKALLIKKNLRRKTFRNKNTPLNKTRKGE